MSDPLFRTITYTDNGTKDSINLDPSIADFKAFVAFTLSGGGTVDYKLQYSLSPMDVSDASALWFDSAVIPGSTTGSAVEALITPFSRIRAVITTLTGGTLTLQVRQGISVN